VSLQQNIVLNTVAAVCINDLFCPYFVGKESGRNGKWENRPSRIETLSSSVEAWLSSPPPRRIKNFSFSLLTVSLYFPAEKLESLPIFFRHNKI
jgi:hypothetical protein